MASFRDPRNPDAVHFPGAMDTKILIILVALLSVTGVAVTFSLTDVFQERIMDLLLILALLLMATLAWPGEIVVDQSGLHYNGIFRIRRKFIPWKRVSRVYLRSGFGQALAALLRLKSGSVAVEGGDRQVRIVHTPRHSDRQRFLAMLKVHGIQPEHATGSPSPDTQSAARS